MKTEIEFYRVEDKPLPTTGDIIVAVKPMVPLMRNFTTTVHCDEAGPLDDLGDSFMFADDITHWAHLPAYPVEG